MVFGWSKTADIAVFKPNVSTPAASDTNLNGNAAGKRKVAALDGAFVQSSTLWGRVVVRAASPARARVSGSAASWQAPQSAGVSRPAQRISRPGPRLSAIPPAPMASPRVSGLALVTGTDHCAPQWPLRPTTGAAWTGSRQLETSWRPE